MFLNKNGWGLKEMIVLSGVILLFLIVSIYYIATFTHSFAKETSNHYYYQLEDKLEEKALIYLEQHQDMVLTNTDVTITRNILKMYNLDPSLIDLDGNACDGYAIASISHGKVQVKGFVQCHEYQTKQYEEWRER